MINNLMTNPTKKINKFQFGKLESLGITHNKFCAYNGDIDSPLQKIWLHIKKAKIITVTKTSITIVLCDQDNDLIQFINSTENVIHKYSTKYNSNLTTKKSIEMKENFPATLKITMNPKTPIFTSQHVMTKPSDVKVGMNIGLFIELENVIMNEKEIFYVWTILQAKILEEIVFTNCFFDLSSVPPAPTINQPIVTPRQQKTTQKSIDVGFTISQNDLLTQIKKLKKPTMIEESDDEES